MVTAQELIDLKDQLQKLVPSGSFGSTYITLLAKLIEESDDQAAVVLTTKGDLVGFDTARNRIPVGTNNKIPVADSALALGIGYKNLLDIPGGSELKDVTADFDVNNDETLADVPGLESSSLSVGKYFVELMLIFEAASTTPDMDIKFIGSANTTLDWEIGAMDDGTVALSTIATEKNVPLGAVISILHIKGYLDVVDTVGTLKLQAAQGTATVEDTSIKVGSILKVTRIS